MSISFSGLGSGLDYSSWIDALVNEKQSSITLVSNKNKELQTKIDSVNKMKSYYSSLQSAVQTLTSGRILNDNAFNKMQTSVSDSSCISASVTSGAASKNLTVGVQQLATSTVLKSDMGSLVANPNLPEFSAGTVKFLIGNEEKTVELTGAETQSEFINKFNTAAGGDFMSVEDGRIKIASPSLQKITFSSSSTSDFVSKLQFTDTSDGNRTEFKSSLFIDRDASIVSAFGVSTGTFTVGGDSFDIDADTTMNDLIDKINSSETAGVEATFDASTGKFKLTSKISGELYVSVGGTSDFAKKVGFLDNAGNVNLSTQTLGQNAKFTVNGNSLEYYSNEIPESVTGVDGLTLTLKKTTENDVDLSIKEDTDDLTDAIATFMDAYNKIITQTAEMTKVTYSTTDGETTTTKAALAFDSQLTSMMTSLKGLVTGGYGDSETIKSIADLGIGSKAAGAALTDNTNTLEFDKAKFLEAFKENPDEVRKFLIGDLEEGTKGLMGAISEQLESNLDFQNGYFASRTASYNSQISTNNERITRMKSSMEAYRTRLEKQFQAMDAAISTMNSQFSYLTSSLSSLFGNTGS